MTVTADISIEAAFNLNKPLFVDLRSPAEYLEATIPGAVNIPFFSNEERAEIGTIYRQESPRRARERGLEIIGPRLSGLVKELEAYTHEYDVVVFCWRGGERSRSLTAVLQLMKIHCFRLVGGYRAYRAYVIECLRHLPRGEVVVLHGLTGCGKTELILRLQPEGYAVVDLEGRACHRGSVFGGVGMGPQPGQKMFDSLLLQDLQKLEASPYLLVECESRRIGKLYLPEYLFTKMGEGKHILVYDSVENRVRRLVEEYAADEKNVMELAQRVRALGKYIGQARAREFAQLIEKRVFTEVVEYLLVNYYDKLYRYPAAADERYDICISTDNLDNALLEIVAYLREQYGIKG